MSTHIATKPARELRSIKANLVLLIVKRNRAAHSSGRLAAAVLTSNHQVQMPAVRTVAALLCLILASCGWCAVGHAQDRVTYSAHVGAGGSKAWNVIGGTAEFFPAGDHLSLFATGGLGTILVGGGIALYTARSDHGLIASATAGLAGSHVQLAGQVRVGPRLFATAGIGAGYYFLQHEGTMPFGSLEYRW